MFSDADKSAKSVPNPAYATWLARDQMVLSYLLGSISPGVMPHIMRLEHAAGVWKALETMFASQSQSKITNLRIAMATTRRLNDSVDVYLLKMQTIADELAAAGKPVPEEEQVAYIMAGLGSEYANLVESYGILKAPPTLGELYAQLQAHDERKTLNYGSSAGVFETSANAASRQSYSRGYTSGGRGAPRDDRRDRRPNRRDDRPDGRRDQRDDRPPRQGRGGGRAPPGGGVDGGAAANAQRRGSTSPVKSVAGRATLRRTAGTGSPTTILSPMRRRRLMLLPTVSIPTGIPTLVLRITSLASSTT
jgi:hypothetical protein